MFALSLTIPLAAQLFWGFIAFVAFFVLIFAAVARHYLK